MNIIRTTTAVLALATGLAAAAAPARAADEPNPIPALDQTGETSLGIDISRAGDSPGGVAQFLAWLGPNSRTGVMGNCAQAVANPGRYHPFVLSFCQTAVSEQPALGFAPAAEPQFPAPAPMMDEPVY